jgi:glucan biosynthesis protein C
MSSGAPVHGRHPTIELLRVGAMLAGLTAHAAVSYMRLPIPELLWATRDRATSGVFDALFWVGSVALSIFFLVAGFSAAKLYERRGPSGFLRDRSRRLLVPFLMALTPRKAEKLARPWLAAKKVSSRRPLSRHGRHRRIDPLEETW